MYIAYTMVATSNKMVTIDPDQIEAVGEGKSITGVCSGLNDTVVGKITGTGVGVASGVGIGVGVGVGTGAFISILFIVRCIVNNLRFGSGGGSVKVRMIWFPRRTTPNV